MSIVGTSTRCRATLAAGLALAVIGLSGCGSTPTDEPVAAPPAAVTAGSASIGTDDAPFPLASDSSTASATPSATATPSRSAKPSPTPSKSPKPKKSPTVKPTTATSSSSSASGITQCVKPKHGTFTVAPVATGDGGVVGSSGKLYRYEIQVQNGIDVTPADFAASVHATLSAHLGWTYGGVKFQWVDGGSCDFVVELATETTSEQICAGYGLSTGGKTNCRGQKEVVIDLTRWQDGDPDAGAPANDPTNTDPWNGHLDVYRELAVNHEVGHVLGYHHMGCPQSAKAPDEASNYPDPYLLPVMASPVTNGMEGCGINGMPYDSGGHLITGPLEP